MHKGSDVKADRAIAFKLGGIMFSKLMWTVVIFLSCLGLTTHAQNQKAPNAFSHVINFRLSPQTTRQGVIDLTVSAWRALMSGQLVAVLLPTAGPVALAKINDSGDGPIIIYDTSGATGDHYSATAELARLNGLPDFSNPNRQPSGAFAKFPIPGSGTGWGDGRSHQKSGALTFQPPGPLSVNLLEGGNLMDPMGSDGMWFGAGGTYAFTARSSLNAGGWVMFGRGYYDHGAGGGVLFHYLIGPMPNQ